MGHFLGAEKIIVLIREISDAAMAGASVESCRFVVLRSPRGRLGSVLYTCKRLRRMRGRSHRCIHISKVLREAVQLRRRYAVMKEVARARRR